MSNVADTVREYISSQFLEDRPAYQLTNDENLIENEVIDSLGIMLLVDFLESTFGVDIEAEEVVVENFETVDAIVSLISTKSPAPG